MFYLAIDTDIWLFILKEIGNDQFDSDVFLFWIENGDISILLPENIKNEWSRNKEKKINHIKTAIRQSQDLAKELYNDNTEYKKYFNIDRISKLAEKKVNDIENLFNSKAILIPNTQDIILEASKRALDCLPPNHRKDSFRDTVNILTILDYVGKQKLKNCYFVTLNWTDYSESKNKKEELHPELVSLFKSAKINYQYSLIPFYNKKLKPNLTDYNEYLKKKQLIEEETKTRKAIENKKQDLLSVIQEPLLIDNLDLIDTIIKREIIERNDIFILFGLIKSKEACKQYFFSKISDEKWFPVLKEKGYFNPNNIPEPIQLDNGFQNPLWLPLVYIEKLSEKINEGENSDLIDDIIEIIETTSEIKYDNYRISYFFIKIINNIPNNKIPDNVLNLIPKWLETRFDNNLISAEVCKTLLPKFLNNKSSVSDIKKAEIILKHLFTIKKIKKQKPDYYGDSYKPLAYLYWLKEIIDDKFIKLITSKCSDNLILQLSENLKNILLGNFHNYCSVSTSNGTEYKVNLLLKEEDLIIELYTIPEKSSKKLQEDIIKQFENKNEEEIKTSILALIKKETSQELNIESKNAIDGISYFGQVDSSNIWCASLHRFEKKPSHYDSPKEVLTLILQKLLVEKAKIHDLTALLQSYINDNKYKLPFFKRLALYIISENWEKYNLIFWNIIENKTIENLFAEYFYGQELYYLLKNNISNFSQKQKDKINKIIETELPKDKDKKEYYHLKWLSALKEDNYFSTKYNKFSSKIGLQSKDFEKSGESKTRIGYISPLTKEQVLEMTNFELAKYIGNFNPKQGWDEPEVAGLAETIQQAIKETPSNYSNDVKLFINTPYIYVYHILHGFEKAWKSKKEFKWKPLLEFCNAYIDNEKFGTDKLEIKNDIWRANSDLVKGAIGNLISAGTREDENAFNVSLMPLAKEILNKLIDMLPVVNPEDIQSEQDYPHYTLNNTSGKVIFGLLDAILLQARQPCNEKDTVKWKEDDKKIINKLFEKKIIDIHIQLGWHFQQFYFIDKSWLFEQVKNYQNEQDNIVSAFIGGYLFSNPLYNKDVYSLISPIIIKMFSDNIDFVNNENNGLARHITTYFFWGFDNVNNDNSLIKVSIDNENPKLLTNIVFYIWKQRNYLYSIKPKRKKQLIEMIFELWKLLLPIKEIKGLHKFITLTDFVDENNCKLIIKSMHGIDDFEIGAVYKELNRLITKDSSEEYALRIAKIAKEIPISKYAQDKQNEIHSLVEYIYKYKSNPDIKRIADKICNKYAELGYDFLNELYRANN